MNPEMSRTDLEEGVYDIVRRPMSSTRMLVPSDILAAFLAAIIPLNSTIEWIANKSRPDTLFIKQLPTTTEFNLCTRTESPCKRLTPCQHSSFVEMAIVSKTELQFERARIEQLAESLFVAWNQANTDIRRLRSIDNVLAEFYPVRYAPSNRIAVQSNVPNLSILNRYFQACMRIDNFQHPALYYWISELKVVEFRFLQLSQNGSSETIKKDAFTAYLILQSQLHIIRNIGLKYALTSMEASCSNITNRFLCELLNPDLPPL